MASKSPQSDGMTETCENCGAETPHTVSVELRTESSKSENAEFSREPYRVSTCRSCGEETSQRMNNA
ncbi:MAG: hypothetical protein ABEJ90_00920 [Halobacterium sp.]